MLKSDSQGLKLERLTHSQLAAGRWRGATGDGPGRAAGGAAGRRVEAEGWVMVVFRLAGDWPEALTLADVR